MITVNGKPLHVTRFPDGTSQVWKLEEEQLVGSEVKVEWDFESEAELVHLLQYSMLLDVVNHGQRKTLFIWYLPYGRQDKALSNHTTFALHPFAKILNGMRFDRVTILDPHSEIATLLIENSIPIYPDREVQKAFYQTSADLICYPDRGALYKYSKIYDWPFIYGQKVRDQATGHIEKYDLFGECSGKRVLIVDDICDGGATFKILAKSLRDQGAENVFLFVTHGIFSKGVKTIFDSGISRVFTSKGEMSIRSDKVQF